MKKLLCIILSLIMIAGTSLLTVNAVENSKISPQLTEVIESGSQDSVPVHIFFNPVYDWDEVRKIVREKYTWTTNDEYYRLLNQEAKSIVREHNKKFISDNSGLFDDVIICSRYAQFVIVNMKPENAPALAADEDIEYLDIYKDVIPGDTNPDNVYETNFMYWALENLGDYLDPSIDFSTFDYDELYYHKNDGKTDWVLCYARYNFPEPTMISVLNIGGIGGRTIIAPNIESPFAVGYGVYDVEADEFFSLSDIAGDYSKYEGLIEALTELNIGYVRGDANIDTTVDILDAAEIQKASVDKVEMSRAQVKIADVNDDQKADILDATAIQKALVAQ